MGDVAVTVSPLKGHDAWVKLAKSPEGISFNREEGQLSAEEFRDVIQRTDLNRPVEDTARLSAMLEHANLVITARDASGRLIGVARSLTDFVYCCYLSDLCVDEAFQGRGIGRALIAETKRIIGPKSMLLLLSAPKPITYYPRIGMEKVENGFIIRRDH
jgi:ribosomal protein S18 acetylase RimI-like enzyme